MLIRKCGDRLSRSRLGTTPFKRLILRAVLGHVSPMVIRVVSVSDRTDLPGLHDVFHAILG
jgi:hypothetical protein